MTLTILHVEDNGMVANAVRDTLELEGWEVETCCDGALALHKLFRNQYDLLLLDNDLPNVSGIDLIRHARKLPHYKTTPIVMLSACDCETEARMAGVDAFLRKPNDVLSVTQVIARLAGAN